jgi:uncharacterized protein
MASNAESIRALYLNLEARDVAAVLASLAPRVRWTEPEGSPYAGTFVGRDAVARGVLQPMQCEWRGFTAIARRLICQGETVVALGEYTGVHATTETEVLVPFVHVWTLRAGRIEALRAHTDTAILQCAMR